MQSRLGSSCSAVPQKGKAHRVTPSRSRHPGMPMGSTNVRFDGGREPRLLSMSRSKRRSLKKRREAGPCVLDAPAARSAETLCMPVSAAQMFATAESLPEPMLLVTATRSIEAHNRASAELLNVSARDVCGTRLDSLMSESAQEAEYVHACAGGERMVSATLTFHKGRQVISCRSDGPKPAPRRQRRLTLRCSA